MTKKTVTFYLAMSLICVCIFAFKKYEERKYSVSMTQQEWATRFQWIEIAKSQLRKSDLPSKDVVFVADSLLGKFQMEMANQLNPQIQAATDTIKKKK